MIGTDKVKKMVYGGDYNPEQWDESVWEEDMRLFKLAGIDIVTVNVFSWALLQRDDETYDFTMLDKIMDITKKNGLYVCLATATGANPAWMVKKYPEILRVDTHGVRAKFGGRENACPNSKVYRHFAQKMATKLAERYKDCDNIVAWHVSNEYSGECHCEKCEMAFRDWLRDRYGTLDALNRAWNTRFWGHTFYDWDEIAMPDARSEEFESYGRERTTFQGMSLDYRRFMSDSMLECYRLERDALKAITPDIPVTTNFMGFFKGLDYQKWAPYLDFIAWDNYPGNDASYSQIAMGHDLMRGLKQGMPFSLMEQTPSVTNWLAYNALKRPGVMRLWSYQAVAHGADTVMFFQMRRSIGACEKYHGAVIDHCGHENTRVFREIAQLGEELKVIGGQTLGARTNSKIALVFDWDNWWALEYSAGPSCELYYTSEFGKFYEALRVANFDVDIIGVNDPMDKYSLVIAPVLYMVKGDYDEKIRAYVKNGGTFITTFFSGIVQENDLVTLGGYPGKLRDIMGIWVEEIDALPNGKENSFYYKGRHYPARLLCDIIHSEGAEVVCDYQTDFYKGFPVITKNKFGDGTAYYIATSSDENFYHDFLCDICEEVGEKPLIEANPMIEATSRENENGKFLFLMNHDEHRHKVTMKEKCTDIITGQEYCDEDIMLLAKEVRILKMPDDWR